MLNDRLQHEQGQICWSGLLWRGRQNNLVWNIGFDWSPDDLWGSSSGLDFNPRGWTDRYGVRYDRYDRPKKEDKCVWGWGLRRFGEGCGRGWVVNDWELNSMRHIHECIANEMQLVWASVVGLRLGEWRGEEGVNDWGRTSVSSSTFSGFSPIGANIST